MNIPPERESPKNIILKPAELVRVLLKFSTYPSSVVLILTNLTPLVGILFWEWNIFFTVFLYWTESITIGFFTICKMLIVGKKKKLTTITFFLGHFGFFIGMHFIYLMALFSFRESEFPREAPWAFALLFLSHLFSFCYNFLYRPPPIRSEWLCSMAFQNLTP